MFSQCKNMSSVLDELNKMVDNAPWAPKKQGMGDKYALVGVNARGAEFITFLDRPVVRKKHSGYDKLIIYKECEVVR